MTKTLVTTAVPFLDLSRAAAEQQAELEAALLAAFRSGQFCNGPAVRALETACRDYLGGGVEVLGVSNGTDGLVLALQGLGVGPGDRVLTPTFSFFASGSCISLVGATPVFADVDPATYMLSRDTLKAAWQDGIKGIIAVHLYGHPAPMAEILDFAREKGVWVLEDAAQAFGASYRGRKVGTFGRATAVSFYPTKNLSAAGDAGLVIATDPALAENIRLRRVHGEAPRYTHALLGRNARMDDVQAAILTVKLQRLDAWNIRRRAIAALYDAAFADLPIGRPPEPSSECEPVYHQYTITCARRDALKDHLQALGIGCGVYYPVPLHRQPLYVTNGTKSLPVAERLASEVLSLPIFPQLTEGEIESVIAGVRMFFAS